MKKLLLSIIIPSYNGKSLLEQNLPDILKAAKKYNQVKEIIVIDDGSQDRTIPFLRKFFPGIKTFTQRKNQGYIKTANFGIKNCSSDLVLLLNNDVKVSLDFIQPLVSHFYRDKNIFAVTAKSITNYKDKKNVIESIARGIWKKGMFYLYQPCFSQVNFNIKSTCTNLHASGGFSVFNRNKFLILNGFDDLYEPFYWEDIDLSYRAWKKGWKILYEPQSLVHHKGHATTNRIMNEKNIETTWNQHAFLFIWKNITDPLLLQQHLSFIRSRLKDINKTMDKIYIYTALKNLNLALKKRINNYSNEKIKDKEIIKISSNIYI